ncbi:MAG TPA: NAD(P)H-dependent oxidoreductase subunit E [Candidatus Omnitrophota bacterium]|jgi:NADH-quinone oxidoreductase subunit E|nr:NAD(P)H-dependent oxidoreductase subunit E [Candidatus Omnitrophota bacterium]HSA30743.1 NAD(P)H-dependent oxidoreductase subunit E [Candidatus Omnitrophota bacterium]
MNAVEQGFQRDLERINQIVEKNGNDRTHLIAILQDIQHEFRFLPEEVLIYLSTVMNIPLSSIYGVATFYGQFSLEPKGKFEIKVCDGTACHVRKSGVIIEAIRKKLGLTAGKKTTDDLKFTFETVSCLGACGLAPVVVINEKVYPQVTPEKISQIIDQYKNEEES